jgi:DNA-binding transcriptional ArsR family regulator
MNKIALSPVQKLASSDRLVHDPSRLAILTVLLGCAEADFIYLVSATGLGKGNLSSHLSKLEEGRLVAISKGFSGKTPFTRVKLTAGGRRRAEAHWRALIEAQKSG